MNSKYSHTPPYPYAFSLAQMNESKRTYTHTHKQEKWTEVKWREEQKKKCRLWLEEFPLLWNEVNLGVNSKLVFPAD